MACRKVDLLVDFSEGFKTGQGLRRAWWRVFDRRAFRLQDRQAIMIESVRVIGCRLRSLASAGSCPVGYRRSAE